MFLLASGCGPGSSPQANFLISTLDELFDPVTSQVIFGPTPHGYAVVQGQCQTCGGVPSGYGPRNTLKLGQYNATVAGGDNEYTHSVTWVGDCASVNNGTQTVANYPTAPGGTLNWHCSQYPQDDFVASPGTIFQQNLPAMVAVDVGVSDGQVNIIDANGVIRDTIPVSSSVNFSFPARDSAGNPFLAGEYVLTVDDELNSGGLQVAYAPLTIASASTSIPSPFGVAPASETYTQRIGVYDFHHCIYSSSSGGSRWPDVTSYSGNSLCDGSTPVPVGANPTAVATFGTTTTTRTWGQCDSTRTTTQTGYAIVTNSGSDTVSIVGLAGGTNLGNATVGHAPVAVAVDSGGNHAYVANYDDGTVSVVSLASRAQTHVIAVGAYPAAVAMDPGGASFWVGGDGYIEQFSTANLGLLANYGVGGFVTSLAISQGQNEVFYTVGTTTGDVTAEEENESSHRMVASYAFGVQRVSGCWGCGGPSDPPLQANSTLVSNILANGLAIGATPTGFALISLMSHQVVYSGTTPNPVRGIAVLPDQSVGWVTVPDSNLVLTVPISPNS